MEKYKLDRTKAEHSLVLVTVDFYAATPVGRKMATPVLSLKLTVWRTETLKRVAVVSTAIVVGCSRSSSSHASQQLHGTSRSRSTL
jgi:hypothetical protein